MENKGRALVPHRGQRNNVALNAAPESREIVVNGRRHIIEGASIGYDQLVRLAYPDMSDAGTSAMTITYRGGPLHAAEGLLTKHQRTPIVQGETFVVGHTIAS